jgi:hypothetical protein
MKRRIVSLPATATTRAITHSHFGVLGDMNDLLMEFTSHVEGRNSEVTIYDDRIEWGRNCG